MRLTEIMSNALNGVTARLRRDAIAYGLCAVCAVVVIVMAISASVLALEPHVGVVSARLIVAGVFLLIAVGAVLWLKLTQPKPAVSVPLHSRNGTAKSRDGATERDAQVAHLAMIAEALMLGYSLSRRSDRRQSRDH